VEKERNKTKFEQVKNHYLRNNVAYSHFEMTVLENVSYLNLLNIYLLKLNHK